ncbi:GntR family transcriptional regulator [Pigmentiphaga sp. YJ18]|uniref:GntR family transcriptional regulator n=1 Tax=Pigmentiphaga sp. YJ18 TaxID=3134907 RepID=UPI0031110478
MSTKTVATQLVPQLRDLIANGSFPPNTKLKLQELGQTFGVSLSSVREALLVLSTQGFVVGEDQRGFRVVDASAANLAEVTTLRAQFEPYALRIAIERQDRAWEEKLVGIFYRLSRIEKEDGYVPFLDEWERAHREFHLCMIGGCQMPLLLQFCSNLHDMSDRYRRIYLSRDMPPQRDVAAEHSAIIDAILKRDADTACELLRTHSQRTGAAALERLQALK